MKKPAKNNTDSQIIRKLSRIEGQLEGVRRMIINNRECIEIIQQIMAIREALGAVGIELLKEDFICKRKNKTEIDSKYLKTLFKMNKY